ncbi:MAG TPA: hypothetical protein VFM31_09675, partial [Nitrososphaeraceae archaeon]|nr:hypothetical protein [Nitrososphaeraceae archaeon]
MEQKQSTKSVILFLFIVTLYSIGNNILYLPSIYADQPDEISKIQNCKNEKIVKKAISKDNGKNKKDSNIF